MKDNCYSGKSEFTKPSLPRPSGLSKAASAIIDLTDQQEPDYVLCPSCGVEICLGGTATDVSMDESDSDEVLPSDEEEFPED